MGCLKSEILEQTFVPMQIRYKSALGIDPLADAGGQQTLSPYHAMGCNPALMVDPFGLQGQTSMSTPGMRYFDIYEDIRAKFPTLHMHLPGGKLFGAVTDYYKMSSIIPSFLKAEASIAILSGGAGGRGFKGSFQSYLISNNIELINKNRSVATDALNWPNRTTREYLYEYFRYTLLEEVVVTAGKADWKDWGKRMHNRFGGSLGYDFEGYGAVQQSSGGDGSWYSWNGPLMRALVPDKFTIALGAEITGILGIGVQPITFSILIRGKEPGIYYTPQVNVNLGAGAFFSAGVEFTSSYFTGDPRNITASMMTGHTYGIMANGGYLADVSLGASYSPTNSRGTQGFINRSAGIGVGVGAFGGAQYQYTIGVIPLWQWKR
ncbi:MAG TPA: hypothetical protein VLZ83_12410 [Edaphocola sp.]|nr:hypothetical protein [Edaphocola sp.]